MDAIVSQISMRIVNRIFKVTFCSGIKFPPGQVIRVFGESSRDDSDVDRELFF